MTRSERIILHVLVGMAVLSVVLLAYGRQQWARGERLDAASAEAGWKVR